MESAGAAIHEGFHSGARGLLSCLPYAPRVSSAPAPRAGHTRRLYACDPQEASRLIVARQEARREAHAGPRREHLEQRLGSTAVTGALELAQEAVLPRGKRHVSQHLGITDYEEHVRSREPVCRFHRPPPESGSAREASYVARRGLMARGGVTEGDAWRRFRSSDTHIGSFDIPSRGILDAFDGAHLAPLPPRSAAEGDETPSAAERYWRCHNVPAAATSVRDRQAVADEHTRAGMQEAGIVAAKALANRVHNQSAHFRFDDGGAAAIYPAVKDEVRKEIQEEEALRAARAHLLGQRLTATARRIVASRHSLARSEEEDMVRRL